MITEDYCSFELSKLLEEKGFPFIKHLYMYVDENNRFMTDHSACLILSNEEYCKHFDELFTPTITHQMAMKWLREQEIYLNIRIAIGCLNNTTTDDIHWVVDILDFNNGEWKDNDIWFDTYEEAVEAALKYVLENLI